LEKLNLRIHSTESDAAAFRQATELRSQELQCLGERLNERVQHANELQIRMESAESHLSRLMIEITKQERRLTELGGTLGLQQGVQAVQQTDIQGLLQQVREVGERLAAQAEQLIVIQSELAFQQVASDSIPQRINQQLSRILADEFGSEKPGSQVNELQKSVASHERRLVSIEADKTTADSLARFGKKRLVEALRQANSKQTHCGAASQSDLTDVTLSQFPKTKFCPASYDFYANHPTQSSTPFIYLDVKSIPRSGLHYLQRSLQAAFGDHYSFCEWYQEPGCCRRMPCALTGYGKRCAAQQTPHVRMIKSHDFNLDDPIFPLRRNLRRLLVIRDPLYSLTSFWSLKVVEANQAMLTQHGINATKINYCHEQPVLAMAYKLIDEEGVFEDAEKLYQWLNASKKYMLGFIEKWGRHTPSESVVRYQHLDALIEQIANEAKPQLSDEMQSRIELWLEHRGEFKSRENPFGSPSKRIAEHLQQHAPLFQQFAEEITSEDKTGLFASCRRDDNGLPHGSTAEIRTQTKSGRSAA
jgi:hypothetical protein